MKLSSILVIYSPKCEQVFYLHEFPKFYNTRTETTTEH